MSVHRWSRVACDVPECPEVGPQVCGVKQDARRSAPDWHVWNGFDLCPGCWQKRDADLCLRLFESRRTA